MGYTTGDFQGTNLGSRDMLLASLSSLTGSVNWVRQFGTIEGDNAEGVTTDGLGGIYVGGYTEGDMASENQGSYDAVIARFNANGNEDWVRQIGGTDADYFNDLATDHFGNLYGVGKSGDDTYVVKYTSEGQYLWDQATSSPGGVAFGVVSDADGRAYVSGTSASGEAYILKLDGDGGVLWFDSYGTLDSDYGYRAIVGGDGKVYLAGATEGDLDGTNSGQRDAFLISLTQTVIPDPPIQGDLNGDGFVGITDLNIILSNWNEDSGLGNYQPGDVTGDGFVGVDDLNRVLGNWNAGSPPATATSVISPEPAAMSLFVMAGIVFIQRGSYRLVHRTLL